MSAALNQGATSFSIDSNRGTAARARIAWQTVVLGIGCGAMALALVVVTLGIPAKMGYNIDGAGQLNENTSWDMLAMSKSIDQNIKYVEANTSDKQGAYNGLLNSINKSEDAIPTLAAGIADMMAAVIAIDKGLGAVAGTTEVMGTDMAEMARISGQSSETMQSLNSDIEILSKAMADLLEATGQLTGKMGGIETMAKQIAVQRTALARKQAQALNKELPDRVPTATTDAVAGGGAQ